MGIFKTMLVVGLIILTMMSMVHTNRWFKEEEFDEDEIEDKSTDGPGKDSATEGPEKDSGTDGPEKDSGTDLIVDLNDIYQNTCEGDFDCVDPADKSSRSLVCTPSMGGKLICDCLSWNGIKLKWSAKNRNCLAAKNHPCVTNAMCHSNKCFKNYFHVNELCDGGWKSSPMYLFMLGLVLLLLAL